MKINYTMRITFDRMPELMAKIPRETALIVQKATMDIALQTVMNAPVDTGYLANSIEGKVNNAGGQVTSGAEYWAYVEYGTYKMAAQPFVTPAVEAVEPQFVEAMRRMMESL